MATRTPEQIKQELITESRKISVKINVASTCSAMIIMNNEFDVVFKLMREYYVATKKKPVSDIIRLRKLQSDFNNFKNLSIGANAVQYVYDEISNIAPEIAMHDMDANRSVRRMHKKKMNK